GRLAGGLRSLGSIPGSLTGALGGGVLLFNLLFLLPARNRVAGKLGVLLQRLLIQGVHVGLFQPPLRLGRLAVGFQLMAAVALLHQMYAGLHRFLGLVGTLHAHIVLFGLPDFLVDFPRHSVGGRIDR